MVERVGNVNFNHNDNSRRIIIMQHHDNHNHEHAHYIKGLDILRLKKKPRFVLVFLAKGGRAALVKLSYLSSFPN